MKEKKNTTVPNGTIFHIKGIELKVVGFVGKPTYNYIMSCSKCSLDEELHPHGSILSNINNLEREQIPCGCSKSPRWKEWQYKVIVERLCAEKGYDFLGWSGNFKKNGTLLKLYDKLTGSTWSSTSIGKLKGGRGDPKERTRKLIASVKYSDEHFLSDIYNSNSYPDGTIFNRSQKCSTLCIVTCSICSYDEFVINGLCDGVFCANKQDIINGVRSCRCSGRFKWTKEQYKYRINNSGKGLFVEWADVYEDRHSRFRWICSIKGCHNTSRLSNFLGTTNSGCATCAKSGFDPNHPANFYIVRWNNSHLTYLKGGITNRDTIVRIREQYNVSPKELEYTILYTFHSEDGRLVQECEKFIKGELNRGVCPKYLLPSGYTETFKDDSKTLDYMVDYLTLRLGKPTFKLKETTNE